jgi:hypothetical protein
LWNQIFSFDGHHVNAVTKLASKLYLFCGDRHTFLQRISGSLQAIDNCIGNLYARYVAVDKSGILG